MSEYYFDLIPNELIYIIMVNLKGDSKNLSEIFRITINL
jgi:hypothetical protein